MRPNGKQKNCEAATLREVSEQLGVPIKRVIAIEARAIRMLWNRRLREEPMRVSVVAKSKTVGRQAV